MSKREVGMKGWGSHALTALVFTLVGAFLASLVFGLKPEWVAPPAVEDPYRSRTRVEVLNGAGLDGLARSVTDSLRVLGFDVVYYGNAQSFDRHVSVVLDRIGSPERALAVAQALGIPNVRSDPDASLYLDVTVLLGRDWASSAGSLAAPRPTAAMALGDDRDFWRWLRERLARLWR